MLGEQFVITRIAPLTLTLVPRSLTELDLVALKLVVQLRHFKPNQLILRLMNLLLDILLLK